MTYPPCRWLRLHMPLTSARGPSLCSGRQRHDCFLLEAYPVSPFTFYLSPLTSHRSPLTLFPPASQWFSPVPTFHLSPLTSYFSPINAYRLPCSHLPPTCPHLSPLTFHLSPGHYICRKKRCLFKRNSIFVSYLISISIGSSNNLMRHGWIIKIS